MSSSTYRTLIAWSLTVAATTALAAPVGTSFTYQGELRVAGTPTSAPHDFQFVLFNVASGGTQIGTLTQGDLPVNAGLFTTELDYTDVPFASAEEYWLEVRVRDGAASGGYTTLLPRQKITPAPYAINARTVQAGGVTQSAIAPGAVGSSQLANNAVTGAKIATATIDTTDIANGGIAAQNLAADAVRSSSIQDGSITEDDIAGNAIRSRHLAAGAVTTIAVAQDAITGDKIAGFAVGALEIAPGVITSNHLASNAVAGGNILDGSIGAIEIAPGAVGSDKIQNGAVGAQQLAAAAVGSSHIAVGAVSNMHLAAESVGAANIGVAAVNNTHLATAAVQSDALAPSAVTGAKIADATITQAKLAFTPGDITAVNTSIGLTGGAATGDVSLGIDFTAVQSRVGGTCGVGEYFRGISVDGSVACEPVPGVPTIHTVHDATDAVGRYAAIAIGADGLPVIAYANTTAGALMVAKCRNSACTGTATVTVVDDPVNTVGAYADIAIGSDGRPVISYQDVTAHQLKVATCSNPACTGAAAIVTIDTPLFQFGADTSIAIAGDGLPVISARDETNLALKVVKCTAANCATSTVATAEDSPTNSVGFVSSIAIGSDGLPVISHYDVTAQALKVAKCANANCTAGVTPTSVDDSASNVGDYNSIAIGNDGFPVISYHDVSAGSLKLAKCNSLNCSGATLLTLDDPANTVGQYSSLAIGADGIPVISHYDPIAGALKFTRCGNAACAGAAVTTTVDDPANRVGRHTSIAIGADGLPVIAYFDVTAESLKAAKCGTRSCQ